MPFGQGLPGAERREGREAGVAAEGGGGQGGGQGGVEGGAGAERLVLFNNGAAGMPNFRGVRAGLVTRVSADPTPPPDALYGIAAGGLRYDAIPLPYDHAAFLSRFDDVWPEGSPAEVSYRARLLHGPPFSLEQVRRGRAMGVGGPRRRRGRGGVGSLSLDPTASRSHRIPVERPVAESCLCSEQAARGGGVELGGGAAAVLALARDAATPTDLAASEGMCGAGRGGRNVGADETVGSVLHSGLPLPPPPPPPPPPPQ